MNLSENREGEAPAELKPRRNKALDAKILAKMREVNDPVLKRIRK